MPTYSYECSACGTSFEREQRISEDPIKKCPQCGALKARRMITSGNFILKGSGWYSDLYSGPSNQKKPPAGDKAKQSGDNASDKAKPAEKAKPSGTSKATASGQKAA